VGIHPNQTVRAWGQRHCRRSCDLGSRRVGRAPPTVSSALRLDRAIQRPSSVSAERALQGGRTVRSSEVRSSMRKRTRCGSVAGTLHLPNSWSGGRPDEAVDIRSASGSPSTIMLDVCADHGSSFMEHEAMRPTRDITSLFAKARELGCVRADEKLSPDVVLVAVHEPRSRRLFVSLVVK
jgi:hypothetical protein